MTKFPKASGDEKDEQLERILSTISAAIRGHDHVPRIARDSARYHAGLWDNVELHLIGCRQGIALVEDRYLDELNPNVAMEWGWMRGMGKRVLFLLEDGFGNFGADLGDLLFERFSWNDPDSGIRAAIAKWLGGT